MIHANPRSHRVNRGSLDGNSQPVHCASEITSCLASGIVRVVNVRIQLDRDPAVVPRLLDRTQRRRKVDRTMSRYQVLVNARLGDVLEVIQGWLDDPEIYVPDGMRDRAGEREAAGRELEDAETFDLVR